MQVLKDAWLEDNVAQCGYCRAGQLMTASALVNRNKHPGEQQVDRAMADNIFRRFSMIHSSHIYESWINHIAFDNLTKNTH